MCIRTRWSRAAQPCVALKRKEGWQGSAGAPTMKAYGYALRAACEKVEGVGRVSSGEAEE